MVNEKEPLLGCELIRVSMEAFGLGFEFNDLLLEIGVAFMVRDSGVEFIFEPNSHVGNLAILWNCIGSKVKFVEWNDSILIQLDNNVEFYIPPSQGNFRGTFSRLNSMAVEDF